MIRCRLAAKALPLLLAPLMLAQKVEVAAQTEQLPPKIKIAFAEGVPYEKVWVGYGLFGPSGGRQYFGVPKASGAPFYEIKGAVNVEAANRLKALVWAPGCKMKAFDVPLGTSDIELHFACDKLKGVTLLGRVQQVDVAGSSGEISVGYDTVGPCLFLDTCTRACAINCIGSPIPDVATAKLESDGTFKIELPNFSADPVASDYTDAGFEFFVRGKKWMPLEPESKEFQSRSMLRIAPSYPNNLIFVPRSWN